MHVPGGMKMADIRIVPLEQRRLEQFREYCRIHRLDHDESYLSPEDIDSLGVDTDYVRLAIDAGDRIVGAYSLMKRGRVRIFHCAEPDEAVYSSLHEDVYASGPDLAGAEAVSMFRPMKRGRSSRF
jgi:hypothetical protein